jgi:hypothetical protein
MNRNRLSIKILALVFHSLAFSIIVFGSIINFHQNKIWGKPLIPQFVGIKRDADKSAKLIPLAKVLAKVTLPGKAPVELGTVPACSSCISGLPSLLTFSSGISPSSCDPDPVRETGLRGPPQA